MNNWLLHSFLGAVLLIVAISLGATVEDSLKTFTLQPIAVIADRPGQSIGTTQVITIAQGESSVSLSLRDMFNGIPGISASSGSKDESSIRLRGFRKTDLRIMIDGRPLTAGYFGNVDLNNILGSDLESILIVKGPNSAMFGTGTLGGTINLLSRPPDPDRWLRLSLILKRNNTNIIEVSSSHQYDSWAYQINASRVHTDGFVLSNEFEPTAFENGGPRNNSKKTAHNIQAKLESDLGLLGRISISMGLNNQDRKEIPSSIFERRYRVYDKWYRAFSTANGIIPLQDDLSLLMSIYYDRAADRYLEYNDPQYQTLSLVSEMDGYSLGINPRLTWTPSSKLTINTGLRIEQHRTKRKDNVQYLSWFRPTLFTGNVFAAVDYDILPNLMLNSSLGVSAYRNVAESTGDILPEPALNLQLRLPQSAVISFSIGLNSSFPTMRQLFSQSTGNSDLKAQTALKMESTASKSFSWRGLGFDAQMTCFYNDINNLIDLYQGSFQNIFSYDSYGAELGLHVRFGNSWQSELKYAWLGYDDSGSFVLTESPHHSCSLNSITKLPWELSLKLSSNWVGKRQSADSNGLYYTLAAYWKHDVQFSRSWEKYRIFCGVENLLDEAYSLEYGYPAGGINFNAGIEINL